MIFTIFRPISFHWLQNKSIFNWISYFSCLPHDHVWRLSDFFLSLIFNFCRNSRFIFKMILICFCFCFFVKLASSSIFSSNYFIWSSPKTTQGENCPHLFYTDLRQSPQQSSMLCIPHHMHMRCKICAALIIWNWKPFSSLIIFRIYEFIPK